MKKYIGRIEENEEHRVYVVDDTVVDWSKVCNAPECQRFPNRCDHVADTKGEPLKHIVRHSPDGFSWGYGGSGPADLASSMLADACGREIHPAIYQRFKFMKLAPLDMNAPFEITYDDVTIALAAIKAELGIDCVLCLDRGTRFDNPRADPWCSCKAGQEMKAEEDRHWAATDETTQGS